MRTRVKICCISSPIEAALAIQYGADALGLVSAMPSGPGVVEEKMIAEIITQVPPPISTFLLTSKTDVLAIINQQKQLKANTLQMVDTLSKGSHQTLREALPGISIVQVIHVTGQESIKEAVEVAAFVDAILLDSGNPNLAVKELGGTGRVHNWAISRKIREEIPIPLFLAGGLNPENARQAIETVEPFGLDICSGVRTNGHLDAEKLGRFFEAIKA